MLTTNDKKKYLEIKKIIAHGIDHLKKPVFWHREAVLAGHNFRLPNHLAALGISQLKKLNKLTIKFTLKAGDRLIMVGMADRFADAAEIFREPEMPEELKDI